MLFWIVAALLTLAACLVLIAPLARPRTGRAGDVEHDLEVYRDQLAEIEREREAGMIAPREAEEARAEIGRRILRADAARRGEGAAGASRLARAAGMAAVLSVPLVSWAVYAAIGNPGLPAQPLQARLERSPDESSVAELIARAEAHLAANPGDARGWDVLAPVYLRLGRNADAVGAFRRSIELDGATADRETGLGEALAAASDGLVTVDAQAAFERALALEPGHPRAGFLLATGYAQEGRIDEARAIWSDMQATLPADSPWQPLLAEALEGADAGTPAEAGADAPAGLDDAGRLEMVEGMVDGLDRRLRDNPDDGEGWQRLIRSYLVLGREDEARAALDRAVAALGADSPTGSQLIAFAATLGIVPDGEQAN